MLWQWILWTIVNFRSRLVQSYFSKFDNLFELKRKSVSRKKTIIRVWRLIFETTTPCSTHVYRLLVRKRVFGMALLVTRFVCSWRNLLLDEWAFLESVQVLCFSCSRKDQHGRWIWCRWFILQPSTREVGLDRSKKQIWRWRSSVPRPVPKKQLVDSLSLARLCFSGFRETPSGNRHVQ